MTQTNKKDRVRRASSKSLRASWFFKKGLIVLSIFLLIIFSTLIVHNVSGKITPQDEIALKKMLKSVDLKENPTFDEEIRYIRYVQNAVLDASALFLKIPLGQPREPQDLLSSGHGQCSDRARTIEKALKYSGFEVRFFSIFSSERKFIPEDIRKNSMERFLRSHALVEVKTSKGWLVVDTNDRWISLDADNNPVSIETWKNVKDKEHFEWTATNPGVIYWLLRGDFMIFYGLYSRHGRFYPPYTPYVPDINLQTMIKGHLF